MFQWAVSTGILSYYLLLIGLTGMLSPELIWAGGIVLMAWTTWLLWQNRAILRTAVTCILSFPVSHKVLTLLMIIHIASNLIGALGPELGFDAIWYHLTIPRIWLLEERIFFITHGTFYYTYLPKLLDMLYLVPLSFGWISGAAVIHFVFGLTSCWATYRLARLFLSKQDSLLAVVVFYTNIVVGWQSTTAYIDLGRTFFESLLLLTTLYAIKSDKRKWLLYAALFAGLAVMAKLLAVTSVLAICLVLLTHKKLYAALYIGAASMLIPLPWFILNYSATGNPVYPIFSGYDLSSGWHVLDIVTIWFWSADPISPIYLIMAPFLLLLTVRSYFGKMTRVVLLPLRSEQLRYWNSAVLYLVVGLVCWWLLPRTGGGRFMMPYLPVLSVLTVVTITQLKDNFLKKFCVCTAVVLCCIGVGYRVAANTRYIPVLFGSVTKEHFLEQNLPSDFGENWLYKSDTELINYYSNAK